MIAVAKRGSAKIITPAADWIRCAQVREPTTRKKASWILRCSQTMPVSPQNTSRWPRSRSTCGSAQATAAAACAVMAGSGHFVAARVAVAPTPALRGAGPWRRAARSFRMNCGALTT